MNSNDTSTSTETMSTSDEITMTSAPLVSIPIWRYDESSGDAVLTIREASYAKHAGTYKCYVTLAEHLEILVQEINLNIGEAGLQ